MEVTMEPVLYLFETGLVPCSVFIFIFSEITFLKLFKNFKNQMLLKMQLYV